MPSDAPILPTAFEMVRPPRATRALAITLFAVFLGLPLLLAFVPWQQNVPASGRVTALDPLDRSQIVPAQVTGRLQKLHVLEGSRVEEGQLIAEMVDQDPLFAERLIQQFEFSSEKVTAARDQVESYSRQLINLELARENAITAATAQLRVAIQKVRSEEKDLEGAEADRDQKKADFERKAKLLPEEVVSELNYQKAESDYLSAEAKVESLRAKVKQARGEEETKMAQIDQIAQDQQAKIDSAQSLRDEAKSKLAAAEKELNEAETKLARQENQTMYSPRSGFVQRVYASSADFLKQGDPLFEIVPETDELVAELWVRGIDAPMVTPGRKVRLQFEGWPAVQFAGWPSVAVGTHGGIVQSVDSFARPDGKVRVLVQPDPDDKSQWPPQPALRQGVRANAWLLLETVSIGREVWRQLNAFPPSVSPVPIQDKTQGGDKSSGGSKGGFSTKP